MLNLHDALHAFDVAWPSLCNECLAVLGSELHYQAMVYHALRTAGGVPVTQLGMNVKQYIPDVQSELFKRFDTAKHKDYRGGFEPIPDVVIFSPAVDGDWRRRRREHTVKHMLIAIEVKASERANGRLSQAEISTDIKKLAAHRHEVRHLGYDFHPIMLIIDSAKVPEERVAEKSLRVCRELACELDVEWRYVSVDQIHADRFLGAFDMAGASSIGSNSTAKSKNFQQSAK
jgi:hypothetical protein